MIKSKDLNSVRKSGKVCIVGLWTMKDRHYPKLNQFVSALIEQLKFDCGHRPLFPVAVNADIHIDRFAWKTLRDKRCIYVMVQEA